MLGCVPSPPILRLEEGAEPVAEPRVLDWLSPVPNTWEKQDAPEGPRALWALSPSSVQGRKHPASGDNLGTSVTFPQTLGVAGCPNVVLRRLVPCKSRTPNLLWH